MISINGGVLVLLVMFLVFGFIAYMDLRTCSHCGKKRSDPPEWMEKYLKGK